MGNWSTFKKYIYNNHWNLWWDFAKVSRNMVWRILSQLKRKLQGLHETIYLEKIEIDDEILIKNPVKPRLYWQFGRVVELFHGEDNEICSVNVKREDRLTQKHLIKHFYPLELTLTHEYHTLSPETDNLNSIESTVQPSLHPKKRRVKKK